MFMLVRILHPPTTVGVGDVHFSYGCNVFDKTIDLDV